MAYSMNESFADNMLDKRVRFDVQPYARGTGVIAKVTPRVVKSRQFMLPYGRVEMTYECFDVVVKVDTGSNTGALWGGVPVPGTTHDLAGKTYDLTGVGYHQLYEAVNKDRPIVISSCG